MGESCRRTCAFFVGGEKHCSCLTSRSCEGCSFFKTPQMLAANRAAAYEQLKKQPYAPILIEKYYGGKNNRLRHVLGVGTPMKGRK